MIVRTFLVPATLQLLGDRAWSLSGRAGPARTDPPEPSPAPTAAAPSDVSS
jgi:uncharacterized membrane protein YdfJ with MMPL/SSD domain